MALLSRLLKITTGSIRLEDFFTEIVAHLFATNQEIFYAWLQGFRVLNISSLLNVKVSTQQTYEPLAGHDTPSRPDIVIELETEEGYSCIFIESKVGSKEGDRQLERYAEILHTKSGFDQKVLLYITRDFDPKDESKLFHNMEHPNLQFQQLRWHQFYHFLKPYKDIALVQEILSFMEEYRMANRNKFSSIDILTLVNFKDSLQLLQEVIEGEVDKEFRKVVGMAAKKFAPSTALSELQKFNRYVLVAEFQEGMKCTLGFALNAPTFADYPTVRLFIEVDPNSSSRSKIVGMMKEICQQYEQQGWREFELNNPNAWSGIIRERYLQEFLMQEDHVAAIKAFLLQTLAELSEIKSQYSDLPW